MENIFLAVSLMIFGFGTLAFSKSNETRPVKPVQPAAIAATMPASRTVKTAIPIKLIPGIRAIVQDTLPEEKNVPAVSGHSAIKDVIIVSNMSEGISRQNGKETTVAQIGDDVYKITKVNGSIVSLHVNGSEVAQPKIGEYKEAINKIDGQMNKMRAEQEIRNKEQAKRNAEQAVRNQEQQKRNAEQAKRNAEQAVRNEEQVKRNAEQAVRNQEQQERNAEQAKRGAEQAARNQEQQERNAEQVERNQEQAERNAEQAIRNKEQEQRNAELRNLMNDLVTANIIKDSNSLKSLSLNNAEMIVNGQKQSSAVHEKFKNKYLKSSTDEINFRNF